VILWEVMGVVLQPTDNYDACGCSGSFSAYGCGLIFATRVGKGLYHSTFHCNNHLPLFPASPFHDLVLFQVLSHLHCHWDWSNGFLPDHLSMKGGGGKVLNMGIHT